MTGKLARAGMWPEETPLDVWCAAVFSVLVDLGTVVDPEKIEDFADKLALPLPDDDRDDLDPDTWGTSEQAQEAQQRLLDAFGSRARVD